jgi:hypothetical protein
MKGERVKNTSLSLSSFKFKGLTDKVNLLAIDLNIVKNIIIHPCLILLACDCKDVSHDLYKNYKKLSLEDTYANYINHDLNIFYCISCMINVIRICIF